jgi:hypothetical protein
MEIGAERSETKAEIIETLDWIEKKTRERQVPDGMKVCSRADCKHGGRPQPMDDFDNNKHTKDGKQSHCKTCRRNDQRYEPARRGRTPSGAASTKPVDKPATKQNERGAMENNNNKNTMADLNNHLFDQMVRLNRELPEDELKKEISRAKAMSGIASQIIQNARACVEGMKAFNEGLIKNPPKMLGFEVNEEV